MVLVYCDAQLTDLLQNANAALLDFAERAESNTVQGHFFEAMGQLTRRRADIQHSFREEINQGFEDLGQAAPPERSPQDSAEGMGLSLLDQDEMEESVATENLILRANASYFSELYALSQRLGVVRGGEALRDSEIPGGPQHLVGSFRRAIEPLNVELRVKIVLYALFDKFVLKNAKTTYEEYNNLLIAAGILPDLKPVPVARDRGPAAHRVDADTSPQETGQQSYSAGPAAGGPTQFESLGEELFATILDMMSTRRGGRGGGPAGARSPAEPSPAEARIRTHELLSAISSIQARQTPQLIATAVAEASQFPNVEVDSAFISRVKEVLSLEREQVLRAIDRDKLSPMDEDLIDLIGMLFEYMLNDPVLPNLAKALLSHLHTPYLKVALIDRRLLVDSRHPARRLLDQMVEAGSLWVEEGNPARGMFPVMQQIVDRIMQEFTEDISLFDEVLAFFDEKMREQQRRSDTMEQRTQEAARGREKLAIAKQRAVREVQSLVSRYPVPRPVAGFLSRTWLDHLVFILLRDQEQEHGGSWRHAIAVAEQLIALFDPDATPETRRTRMAAIPRLREEIIATTGRLGSFNASAVDAVVALLNSPHHWQSQDLERHKIPMPKAPVQDTGPPTPANAAPRDEDLSEPERQMLQRLRKMRFGTWFEFTGAPGTIPQRIKLSWISPLTSTCMFVDKAGKQAEIKGLRDLAQEILAGRARVIPRPTHPFIDRALVSIRKMLQGEGAQTEMALGTRA
jgi:hypothetical protein